MLQLLAGKWGSVADQGTPYLPTASYHSFDAVQEDKAFSSLTSTRTAQCSKQRQSTRSRGLPAL